MEREPGVITTDSQWLLDQGNNPWQQAIDVAELAQARVRLARMSLPDHYRNVLDLRVFGHYTFQEIANTLGLSSRSVAHIYYKRALTKMEEYINNADF